MQYLKPVPATSLLLALLVISACSHEATLLPAVDDEEARIAPPLTTSKKSSPVFSTQSIDCFTMEGLPCVPITPKTPIYGPVITHPAPTKLSQIAAQIGNVSRAATLGLAPSSDVPADRHLIGGHDQLLRLNPDHYTLQWIAGRSVQTVKYFLQKHRRDIHGSVFIILSPSDDPWYRLLQGDYATEQAGRDALARLPAHLQQQQPWLRTVQPQQSQL